MKQPSNDSSKEQSTPVTLSSYVQQSQSKLLAKYILTTGCVLVIIILLLTIVNRHQTKKQQPNPSNNPQKQMYPMSSPMRLNYNECGYQKQPPKQSEVSGGRFLGGWDAADGEYPWLVALRMFEGNALCGGALITAEWVVSAAHCITATQTNNHIVIGKIQVFANFNGSNFNGPSRYVNMVVMPHAADASYFHNEPTLAQDLTLLRVSPPFIIDDDVRPICMHWGVNDNYKSFDCTTAGYGRPHVPLRRQQVKGVTPLMITDAKCREYTRKDWNTCVMFPHNTDICEGDSGGPMQCVHSKTYRRYRKNSSARKPQWQLFGVASTQVNPDCVHMKSTPSQYVYIPYFFDWISDVVDKDRMHIGDHVFYL